jgi:hypothetical protein
MFTRAQNNHIKVTGGANQRTIRRVSIDGARSIFKTVTKFEKVQRNIASRRRRVLMSFSFIFVAPHQSSIKT